MTEETKKTNPLWMPEGSVRSILVLGMIGITAYMLLKGSTLPEWFITLVSGAIMYYFGARK